jgi:broad specificity phosphatase PhoE
MGDLILLRHGETEWSLAGKHTGRTDIPLTPRGEAAAAALAPMLAHRDIVDVFTSPARRAGWRMPPPTPTCGSGTMAATRA